jgi:hypothetical protein
MLDGRISEITLGKVGTGASKNLCMAYPRKISNIKNITLLETTLGKVSTSVSEISHIVVQKRKF